VGSHQDKDTPWKTTTDLLDLKLFPEATLNVLCDKMAMETRLSNHYDPDADVLPSEKWALFVCSPIRHKITCKLEPALRTSLYFDDIQKYVSSKNGLTDAKIDQIMMDGLEQYLKRLKPHNHAAIIKLMHKWIPTNNFFHKKGRADSPVCPRCSVHKESAESLY
jgi:hypothetical protein